MAIKKHDLLESHLLIWRIRADKLFTFSQYPIYYVKPFNFQSSLNRDLVVFATNYVNLSKIHDSVTVY